MVAVLVLSHGVEEVFHARGEEKVMVEKFGAGVCFYESVEFVRGASDVRHYDPVQRDRGIKWRIVVETVLANPQFTLHAEVRDYWGLWVNLFNIHLRQAL